jgi:hypothetical protein
VPRGLLREICLSVCLLALVVSADVTPEARDMLLERGQGAKDCWITTVFYT